MEVDGKYAASAVQLDMTLARLVAKGKTRTRHFELQSTFLPQVQRGMGCTLVLPGGEHIDCEIATYAHKVIGNTLATARTDVVLDEITAFTPVYNPSIVSGRPGVVVPKKGEQGDPGERRLSDPDTFGARHHLPHGTAIHHHHARTGLAGR